MNKCCGYCNTNLLEHLGSGGKIVPYEENDKLFTLQFCSESCRDAYKEEE